MLRNKHIYCTVLTYILYTTLRGCGEVCVYECVYMCRMFVCLECVQVCMYLWCVCVCVCFCRATRRNIINRHDECAPRPFPHTLVSSCHVSCVGRGRGRGRGRGKARRFTC